MVIVFREYKAFWYYIAVCHTHFPTKIATVEALQSNMHQCSSHSGHTHLQLLNRVILSNTKVECSAQAWLCQENFEPAPIWFVLERLQSFSKPELE